MRKALGVYSQRKGEPLEGLSEEGWDQIYAFKNRFGYCGE